jgi:hypothetical protein
MFETRRDPTYFQTRELAHGFGKTQKDIFPLTEILHFDICNLPFAFGSCVA